MTDTRSKKYIRVSDIGKYYPLTVVNVRHLILNDIKNFRETVIKIGGKIYLHTERLENWIDNQRMPHKDEETHDSEGQNSFNRKGS